MSRLRTAMRAACATLAFFTYSVSIRAEEPAGGQGSGQTKADFESALANLSPRVLPQVADTLRQLDAWQKEYKALAASGNQLYDLMRNRPGPQAAKDEIKAWTDKAMAVVQSADPLKQVAGPRIAQRIDDAGGVNAAPEDVRKIVEEEAVSAAKAWAATWLTGIEKHLEKQYPELLAAIDYANTLQAKAKEIKSQVDAAEAQIDAVGKAARAYHDQLSANLARLRDPAKLASDFLAREFKDRFLNKETTVGGVTFTTLAPDQGRSLFSPDANIGVKISYKAAGYSVTASGLYFRYRSNQLPEPVFDRIKMKPSGLDDLMNNGLKTLGDALPDLGLPVQVKDPKFNDFSSGDSGKRGSVEFTAIIGLDGLLDFAQDGMPKIQAGVVLFADGRVKVGDLKATIKTQVPIGSSGLILDGGSLELRPQDKKRTVVVATSIAPATGGKQGVSLDVEFGFGFPVTKTGISYKGAMKLANGGLALGTVEGVISREKVTFQLDTFDKGPAAPPYKIHVKGELNREGVRGDGTLEAFNGLRRTKGSFYVGFNGHGSFTLSDGIELSSALKAELSLQGKYSPGFKDIWLQGVATAEVDVDPLGSVSAELEITATSSPQRINVAGTAMGSSFAFQVKNFNEIYDELKRRLVEGRKQLYQAMARAEKNARNYAAERERVLDDWIYQRAKALQIDALHIDGGGPIDAAMGKASQRAKDLARIGANWRDNAGKELAGVREHAEDFIADPGAATGIRKPEDAPGAVVGWAQHGLSSVGLGLTDQGMTPAPIRVGKQAGQGGGFHLTDPGKEMSKAQADAQKALHQAKRSISDTQRFQKMLEAIERHRFTRTKHALKGETGELRVRFDRAVIHRKGQSEIVVTFIVQSAGYTHLIDPYQKGPAPKRTSGAGVGEIRITGLGGTGRPKVHVDLPKLAHSSPWDADTLVHEELFKLVEKVLPNAQVDGRFEERVAAVYNHAAEPIMVWVQVETKRGQSWQWSPAVGHDKPALRYIIPAGKTLSLNASDGQPLKGRKMRIWAESQSGLLWLSKTKADVWLVDDGDKDGDRDYYADRMEHFVYHFWAAKGPHQLQERIVEVTNSTGKALTVQAQSLSHNPTGGEEWDRTTKPIKVEPGKTVKLWQANGWYLRGRATKFTAQDEDGNTFRWNANQNSAVTQVPQGAYKADTIGTFRLVLGEPGTKAPGGLPATSVYAAADQVYVPPLKGKTLQEAQAALTKLHVKAQHDSGAPTAKVLEQSPAPGWQPATVTVQLTLPKAAPSEPGNSVVVKLAPGAEAVYWIEFAGGKKAWARGQGQGTSDVDLYIYDKSGKEIAKDTELDDTPHCTWDVPATQVYKVKVINFTKDAGKNNQVTLTFNGTIKPAGGDALPKTGGNPPKGGGNMPATKPVTTVKTLTVGPNAKASFTMEIAQGKKVRVTTVGNGKTDVDLYVTGPGGLSVSDLNDTDRSLVTFTARGTGQHLIELRNLGKTANPVRVTVEVE